MLEAEREFKTAQTHSGAKRKEQIIEDALFNYLLVKKKKEEKARQKRRKGADADWTKQTSKKKKNRKGIKG